MFTLVVRSKFLNWLHLNPSTGKRCRAENESTNYIEWSTTQICRECQRSRGPICLDRKVSRRDDSTSHPHLSSHTLQVFRSLICFIRSVWYLPRRTEILMRFLETVKEIESLIKPSNKIYDNRYFSSKSCIP